MILTRFSGGFASVILSWATVSASPAQTFTKLVDFMGASNGSMPLYGSLVQGFDGGLYGAAQMGGNVGSFCANGCGTVFKVTQAGTLAAAYAFYWEYGSYLTAGLTLQAGSGDFFGACSGQFGSLYKITPAGIIRGIYSFNGGFTGGQPVTGTLVETMNGDFYGTTQKGGTSLAGTIFKVSPGPTGPTVQDPFYSFKGTDGAVPIGGLVQALSGNLYGTTLGGGANGYGTVYQVTPTGALTTLYNFSGPDGANPYSALTLALDRTFYGTTESGGASGDGTIFKITPSGTLTTVYNFSGTDGANPTGTLIQASDGKFYGTTSTGGAFGYGTIFQMTPAGILQTLHSFDSTDGATPDAGLLQATDGKFYGTTYAGGAYNLGTVYALNVGLGPFVKPVPGNGKVGSTVAILGTSLTGATQVTFNGTKAAFAVVSSTEITTTIPAGATSGLIRVSLPGGTLSSGPFFVLP